MDMVEKTKNHFLKVWNDSDCNVDYPYHMREMIRWIGMLLRKFPEADEEILLISAWLHDIGDVLHGEAIDHSTSSEKEARMFLGENNFDEERLDQVAHCVRAHRNKGVKPQSLEAKIIVVADSASHMTSNVYLRRLNEGREALPKLERDYADFGLLPGIKAMYAPLYHAWKNLIQVYPALERAHK